MSEGEGAPQARGALLVPAAARRGVEDALRVALSTSLLMPGCEWVFPVPERLPSEAADLALTHVSKHATRRVAEAPQAEDRERRAEFSARGEKIAEGLAEVRTNLSAVERRRREREALLLTVARVVRSWLQDGGAAPAMVAADLAALNEALAPFEAANAARLHPDTEAAIRRGMADAEVVAIDPLQAVMTSAEAAEQAGLAEPRAPQAMPASAMHVVLRFACEVPATVRFSAEVAHALHVFADMLLVSSTMQGRQEFRRGEASVVLDWQVGQGLDGYRSLNQLIGRPVR